MIKLVVAEEAGSIQLRFPGIKVSVRLWHLTYCCNLFSVAIIKGDFIDQQIYKLHIKFGTLSPYGLIRNVPL